MDEEFQKEFFCTICSLQFRDAFVFNLHLSLLHKKMNLLTKCTNEARSERIEISKSKQSLKSNLEGENLSVQEGKNLTKRGNHCVDTHLKITNI